MGRLIDADKLLENQYRIDDSATLSIRDVVDVEDIEDAPTAEAIPKTDYENRLKADLKAILVELQLEIEELDSRAGYDGNGMPTFSTDYIRKNKVNELIQQKINSLKE